MRKFARFIWILPLVFASSWSAAQGYLPAASASVVVGQVDAQRMQLATLVQEMQTLKQEMGRLKFQVDQLEARNQELFKALENQQKYLRDMQANVVTLNELRSQISASQREVLADNQKSQRALAAEVNKQIETLGQRTDQALAQMARALNQAPRPTSGTTTRQPGPYPETGTTHTVARGDTLSGIASRYGASINHIMDANGITDARTLQVGHTLFIPLESSN